jgi:hypothetical protein
MRRPVNMDIIQRQSLVEAAKWVDEEGLSVHGQYVHNYLICTMCYVKNYGCLLLTLQKNYIEDKGLDMLHSSGPVEIGGSM